MSAASASSLDDRIRRVLLGDWDPHNAARNEAAQGSYDLYIAPLRAMLEAVATDEETLVNWLKEREEETMCFPSLGTRRLRGVAQKLLALRDTPASPQSSR